MRIARTACVGLAVLPGLAGCAASDGGSTNATVRDSAGIAIVENHVIPDVDTATWSVDAMPAVSIGVTDGDPAYQFQYIRRALTLSDGRIVVADGGSLQIRYYDADGRHLRSIGREGEGPGEFSLLDDVYALPGDSLIVVHGNTSTMYSLFDQRGEFVRLLRNAATFARPYGQLADRTFVFELYAQSVPYAATGHVRDSIIVLTERMPTASTVSEAENGEEAAEQAVVPGSEPFVAGVDTIVRVPGNEEFRQEFMNGISNRPRAFGRRVEVVTDGVDEIAVAIGSEGEIRVYADGELDRIIRFTGAREPLTAAEIEEWKEWARADAGNPARRRLIDDYIAAQEFPEHRPVSSSALYDRDGNLWLERYRADAGWGTSMNDEPRRWYVLDPEGRAIGAVDLPADLEVHEIGRDHILGVTRDDLGVERVVVHRLSRPTP